jgi:hypothetical protein
MSPEHHPGGTSSVASSSATSIELRPGTVCLARPIIVSKSPC